MRNTPVDPRAKLLSVSELMRGRWTLTPVTALLLAGNLTVFAVMLAHGAGLWHAPNDVQLAWGANFGPATRDGEWWRIASAMFVHFGLLHLAVNMWALWDSGRFVERLYGHARFLIIFGAGGMAGNLCSLLVNGDRAVSGGASGAIFSAYGALLVWLWRERRQVHPVEFRWLFGGAAAFAAATIAMGLLIPGIDNAAHLGGLICGALAGRALATPVSSQSPAPGIGRWIAAAAFCGLVIALFAAIPAPTYRWHDEQKARTEILEFLAGERRIHQRWRTLFENRHGGGLSFEDLAARIESDVTSEYRDSFEQLSGLHLDPAAPSAGTLEMVKRYAQRRGEASHALTEALLLNDPQRIHEALEALRSVPYGALGEAPPESAEPTGGKPRLPPAKRSP
jgi:rhomboid protease GluP